MTDITADSIRPIGDFGEHTLTEMKALMIRARDADAFAPYVRPPGGPWVREFTQNEAREAIGDRHNLMNVLADALETIAKLAPYKLDLRDMDNINELPDGTLVQECNGELAVKTTSPTGEALWQSPGDGNSYRAAQLCYPLTVIPVPPVADDE